MALEHLKKIAGDLGELAKNVAVDTAKISAIVYPWYVGAMSQINDTKFFEQAYDSLPLVLGVFIGAAGLRGMRYLKRNSLDK